MEGCQVARFYWPDIPEDSSEGYCNFLNGFTEFLIVTVTYQSHLSILCFLANLLHFLILTRKPMRTSSVNILMAQIALFDMISLFINAKELLNNHLELYGCAIANSYWYTLLGMVLSAIRAGATRCATWLALAMAAIRALVVRNPMNPKFDRLSRPKAGFCAFLIVMVVSTCFSVFGYFRVKIECYPYQYDCLEQTRPYCTAIERKGRAQNYYQFVDAILSRLLPCVLLPFVSILLILAVRKADENRRKLSVSQSQNKSQRSQSKLVIWLSLTLFIAELPLALDILMQWVYHDKNGVLGSITQVGILFYEILALNSALHMLICFAMSTEYRNSASSIFCCSFCQLKKRNVIVSSSPSSSKSFIDHK